MNNKNNLKMIEWNVCRFSEDYFSQQTREGFLCYFNQNFNKRPNQLMLEEHLELKDALEEKEL